MAKKKEKCECPKPGLSAPFYLLTYGDMMTLLMAFFVLLFAMSTIDSVKFQAQVSVMQGSLGITQMYQHAPMQQNLPSPAVKQSVKVLTKAKVTKSSNTTSAEGLSPESAELKRQQMENTLHKLTALGTSERVNVILEEDEITLVLPTFGIFRRGDWRIDTTAPEVHQAKQLYHTLAEQIAGLADYDIYFVGHTDAMYSEGVSDESGAPKTATELGFRRATALYNYFFADELRDTTRITFASQGDNVPIIPDAKLDSELRKNRRVQIHLKRKKS